MRTINISKFKGMITDVEETHLPNNAFVELYNWRRTKDNILEKIPGYKKHTDFLFDTAVNSITQLKRTEDDNIFYFDTYNVYREDISGNVTVLEIDYPITQTQPYDPNMFSKVRTVAMNNRLWGVDKNLYPFFIYNLSDEAGINLNVWAELIVIGSDTIRIVDANDSSLIYKTITIPSGQNDGTTLYIQYNDGSNIYVTSSSWIYKFNYSVRQYEIVLSYRFIQDLSNNPILSSNHFAFEFADTSFAITRPEKYAGEPGTKAAEYNYDFALQTSAVNVFWTEAIARFKSELGAYITFATNIQSHIIMSDAPDSIERITIERHAHEEKTIGGANFSMKFFDVYGDPSFIDGDAFPNEGVIESVGSDIVANDTVVYNVNGQGVTHFRSRTINYCKVKTIIFRMIMLKYNGSIYIAGKLTITWESRHQLTYSKKIGTWIIVAQEGDNTLRQESYDAEVVYRNNAYTLNIESPDKTFTQLKAIYDAGSDDGLIGSGYKEDDRVLNIIFEDRDDSSVEQSWSGSGTTPELKSDSYYENHKNLYWWNYFTFTFGLFPLKRKTKDLLPGKTVRPDDPSLFYPYITEYNPDDWIIQMMGTPGRPYVLKTGSGTIDGDYKFYTSYVTTLDAQSETFKSPSYGPLTFNGSQGIDVYWAVVPTDYYGNTFIGLRIYAENISTGDIDLIKEVPFDVAPSSDWQKGFTSIGDITPIISILNVKPYFPKMELNSTHLGRYIMSGNKEAPNAIYFSATGDPNDNPLENAITIYPGDKDKIRATGSLSARFQDSGGQSTDRFLIFKNNHVYGIVGDLANPQGTMVISKKYGCVAPDTLVIYKNVVLFFSHAGLCMLDGQKVIEISRTVINNWIFENFTLAQIQSAEGIFDIDNKEYRLSLGKYILVFDLSNEFYLEKKLRGSHLYTAISRITLGNGFTKILFASTENRVFVDKETNHWDGMKRWASLKTKRFKMSDFDEKSMLSTININAELNNDLIVFNKDTVMRFKPQYDNFYTKRIDDFSDPDVQFEIFERSSWDCKLFDLQLLFE